MYRQSKISITDYVSSIQDQYIDDNGLGHTTHVIKWNRQFIRLIMDYTNDIWLFRCSVLHGQDKVHRNTVVRNQAVDLLMKLRRDPYKLPHGSRDLAIRSRSKIMSSELSSVLNWISRVSNALDIQSKNLRLGRQDIRDWLKTGAPYERSRNHRDGSLTSRLIFLSITRMNVLKVQHGSVTEINVSIKY